MDIFTYIYALDINLQYIDMYGDIPDLLRLLIYNSVLEFRLRPRLKSLAVFKVGVGKEKILAKAIMSQL